MKHILYFLSIFMLLDIGACTSMEQNNADTLEKAFVNPPESSRPGVYWYFMDGNMSQEGMTKDLESMKKAGIGSVVFLEVNLGIPPRGECRFMNGPWKQGFKHAVKECERLGISMILGTGPGWTGSGGPWVKAEESMKHLVMSEKEVTGKGLQTIHLDVPQPKRPYFGERALTPELKNEWLRYYEDVAVLAFPSSGADTRVKDSDEKALYYRAPYSSVAGVKQYLARDTDSEDSKGQKTAGLEDVIDLTPLLQGNEIKWEVPEGRWTIMRIGARSTGAITRPAPRPGLGFECDKTDTADLMAHLDAFTGELFRTVGERDTSLPGGLKILHMDSWEMGAQNWSENLISFFKEKRGYDPKPYFPVYAGHIIGSKDISERFLWDLRQTLQELMLENHSGAVKAYAHKNGMQLSIEPYDMNPMQDLELGASADIPMAEFWSPGNYNTTFSATEASSIANIKGQRTVPSEAFTSPQGWEQYPTPMKNQTDWALAAGINRLTFHTFQHQSLPDHVKPGMTMGGYGIQWNRNQTWWPYVWAYHKYIARCQYLMQQGTTVSDILYLVPEEAPFVFRAPESFYSEKDLPDKRNYSFDACPASLFRTADVSNGNIRFPSGIEYKVLILPHFKTMTLGMLQKIESLLQAGATVIGLPPEYTPGLKDYQQNDRELKETVSRIWGSSEIPATLKTVSYGKGRLIWGTEILEHEDNLYPDHSLTCSILEGLGLPADFRSDIDDIRYIHKDFKGTPYYFIANRTGKPLSTTCHFRISGKQPWLWDAVTGKTRILPEYEDNGRLTSIAISMDKFQSYFIFFRDRKNRTPKGKNFYPLEKVQELQEAWEVAFDPAWGGPESPVRFEKLTDWKDNPDKGIKYYSGTAVYTQTFQFSGKLKEKMYLDLGKVCNIAQVRLNGKDLGVLWTSPWRVDISDILKKGENKLEIEIVNLWHNRLIGDQFLPYDGMANRMWPEWLQQGKKRTSGRYTFVTRCKFRKDSPLQESGLLGPVCIYKEVHPTE